MREGSLEAPTRHPIDWQSEQFYDEAALDAELRRVFDICHGCRRCFNLCDSFPRLFDLIDEAPSGELDTVESKDFQPVIDACTLCDMCFMTKCPYVPPHEFNLDFPHLMLRARAVAHRKGETRLIERHLAETDRVGPVATFLSGAANMVTDRGNSLGRNVLEAVAGLDPRATLPRYADMPLTKALGPVIPEPNADAPAFGRKAVFYATCFHNYNDHSIATAAIRVLAHNGVAVTLEYPGCCGMPKLENGDLPGVTAGAAPIVAALLPYAAQGYDIVAATPSCALMLKFEWPLLMPGNAEVKALSEATYDLSEYVVDIAKKHGLAAGLQPLAGGISVHLACHSRAQNFGPKAVEMLKLIPEANPALVERCSGHGGKWGYFKGNFDTAIKVGTPAGRALVKTNPAHVVTECPLAGPHLEQVLEAIGQPKAVHHPIELLARAYGLERPT